MKERVLWVHQNFVSGRQPGNARAVGQVAALVEAGFEVDLVTTSRSYLESVLDRQEDQEERSRGLTLLRLDLGAARVDPAARKANYLRFLRRSFAALLRLTPPTRVFASTPPLPQLVPLLLASARSGAPLVLEIRDLWPAFLEETGLLRSRALVWAMRWLEAVALRYAARCVVVTPGFAELVKLQGVKPGRIAVLASGCDRRMAVSEAERLCLGRAWRVKNGIGDGLVALYAGSLNEHYAIDVLIRTAERLAQRGIRATLVICGDGRERSKVEAAAARTPTLRYGGALARDAMRTPYAGADVALAMLRPLPLFEAIFPGKVFDALAAGVPIVTAIRGHTAALVEAAGAGWVVEGCNAEALAHFLAWLSHQPQTILREHGLRGQAFARRYLDAWDLARRLPEQLARADAAGGWGRLGWAIALGLGDLVLGRNTAYRRLDSDRRRALLDRAFRKWMDDTLAAPAQPDRPLSIPDVLRLE